LFAPSGQLQQQLCGRWGAVTAVHIMAIGGGIIDDERCVDGCGGSVGGSEGK